MANTAMGGFRWIGSRNGSHRPHTEICQVATGYTAAIFKGDPVVRVADGTIWVAPANTDPVAGAGIYGVADGVEQYWDGKVMKGGNYLPASTSWGTVRDRRSLVRVILARDALFEVDADDAVTATTEAAYTALINTNCDHHTGAGGSTVTGISSYALDISTADTVSAGWRIVGLGGRINQDWSSANVKLIVEVNESSESQFSASATI